MWFHRKKHASDEKKKIKKKWSAKRKGILAIVLVLFLVSGGVLTKLVISRHGLQKTHRKKAGQWKVMSVKEI